MGTYNVVPVTALDYRRLAEKRLPRFLFDYIDGGSGEEESLAANVSDFRHVCLKQRVMRDVSNIDTSCSLSGQEASMPLVLAPIGLAGMFRKRGEAQGVRAALTAGVPMTTSTVGICSIEEVNSASPVPAWFQLYMLRDRDVVLAMLERAWRAGSTTLVFTVDLAVTGKRYRDNRNGMFSKGLRGKVTKAWQLANRPRWLYDVGIKGKPHDFGNLRGVVGGTEDLDSFKKFLDAQFDQSVTWEDIRWLRQQWKGRIIIKGVMCAEDAQAAVDSGADGVVVSNHGGRQLEGVASSVSKLPAVAGAVAGQAEIYMDGGIRSGTDVVKALCLGANGVMIGRPWVWAIAAGGEQGLTDLLGVFGDEIRVAMALMGVRELDELGPDLVDLPR